MQTLVEVVRKYALAIDNGRTQHTIVNHMKSEVLELEEEIENGSTGADGIIGENIDVIACALDSIFVHNPEITEEELVAIMIRKCDKWVAKYA